LGQQHGAASLGTRWAAWQIGLSIVGNTVRHATPFFAIDDHIASWSHPSQ
jgi:hypothetical protein